MACESCSSKNGGVPGGCRNHGLCTTGGCNKMEVYDWLSNMEMPEGQRPIDIVEVRFKNGRKLYYRNVNQLDLYTGDAVAVEASPGYDVGVVTLTGELVRLQLSKKGVSADSNDLKKIFRKAKPEDIEKWKEARDMEWETMHRARKMALNLGLEMKISDVEYQGDKTKATFYYTAEGRVDFRELIKVMADEFKIRIEMRQIGARQEASRLGGIGSCGRELCCSTWLNDFRTVSTSAARYQQLSLNPQKLAGQCGKLKCCLNYELDMYVEAYKEFPDNSIRLQTKKGSANHVKTDIFKRMMWYAVEGEFGVQFIGLKIDRVKEIIALNKNGEKVEDLKGFVEEVVVEKQPEYENVVGQDSLTRFDEKRNRNKKGKGGKDRRGPQQQQGQKPNNQQGGTQQKQQRPQQQGQNQQRPPQQKQQGQGQQQRNDQNRNNNQNNNNQNNNRNNQQRPPQQKQQGQGQQQRNDQQRNDQNRNNNRNNNNRNNNQQNRPPKPPQDNGGKTE